MVPEGGRAGDALQGGEGDLDGTGGVRGGGRGGGGGEEVVLEDGGGRVRGGGGGALHRGVVVHGGWVGGGGRRTRLVVVCSDSPGGREVLRSVSGLVGRTPRGRAAKGRIRTRALNGWSGVTPVHGGVVKLRATAGV